MSNGVETPQKLESRRRRDSVIAWVAGVLSLIALPVGNAVGGRVWALVGSEACC